MCPQHVSGKEQFHQFQLRLVVPAPAQHSTFIFFFFSFFSTHTYNPIKYPDTWFLLTVAGLKGAKFESPLCFGRCICLL